MKRRHAVLAENDTEIFAIFEEECKPNAWDGHLNRMRYCYSGDAWLATHCGDDFEMLGMHLLFSCLATRLRCRVLEDISTSIKNDVHMFVALF